MRLSAKQSKLYLLDEHDSAITIADGPVRSGKTWAGLFGLLRYAAKYFNQHHFIIGVQSDIAWRELIRPTVEKWAVLTGYNLRWTDKYFTFSNDHRGVNKFVRIVANSVAAQGRISGPPFAGAYCTEVTFMPMEFLLEVGLRTAETSGRKLVFDCNPQGASHWFKQNYIDRAEEIGARHFKFTEADNPIMTPEKWEQIKRETPPGLQYRRRILGEWVDASDVIWDLEELHAIRQPPDSKPKQFDVAVDTATSSVTHALLIAHYADRYAVVDEWRHDGQVEGAMTNAAQVAEICGRFNAFTQRYNQVTKRWVVDPASAHFKAEVMAARRSRELFGKVYATNNNVNLGIDTVSYYLSRRYLTISPWVKYLIRDISSYVWDETWAAKGEDKPLKKDDHGCDALRYWAVMHNQSKQHRPPLVSVVNQRVG